MHFLTVWRSIIRKIEGNILNICCHGNVLLDAGHFGSGVASYFVFLRLLCILNICLGVVVVSFLVVPQVSAHGYSTFASLILPHQI